MKTVLYVYLCSSLSTEHCLKRNALLVNINITRSVYTGGLKLQERVIARYANHLFNVQLYYSTPAAVPAAAAAAAAAAVAAAAAAAAVAAAAAAAAAVAAVAAAAAAGDVHFV